MNINTFVGKTFTKIDVNRDSDIDEIIFTDTEGKKYRMYHLQDCCESVYIEDICGNIEDLIGSPILTADERWSHEELEAGEKPKYRDDSFTWTFYELATNKGSVTIRWYGSSNGYYSESVDLYEVKN